MPNPSQIVSQINLLISSRQGVTDAQLKETAETFAHVCREVNERLARVQGFLSAGLRSEALYVADIEPGLLGLCKAVDQIRMEEWDRVCAEAGLERAQRIAPEGIKQLKEAAAAEHAIKPLLKRHRRLALCQAPLKERLEVLRELAKADAGNPIWEQDVKVFESARLGELTPFLKQPNSITELARAQDIIRELTDDGWRIKIPQELLDNAKRAVARLQTVEALKEARVLLPKVHAAHKAQDYAQVKALVNELNEITENRGVLMPAEVQTELLNVYEWVAREEIRAAKRKEFNEACTQLRMALDRKADVIEVNRLWEAARDFELALPDELEREAQLRIRNHELSKRRRTQLVIFVIVLVIGGVVAMVAREVRERGVREKIAAVQKQVNDAIASGKLDAATTALGAMAKESPSLANRPEIQKLNEDVKKRIADEENRKATFARLFDEAVAKGVDEPDAKLIEELTSLVKLEPEQDKLAGYLRDVEAAREVRQSSIDLLFTQQAQALLKDANSLSETRADSDPAGLRTEIESLEKRLAELDANKQASEETRLRLEPIKNKLHILRSAVKAIVARRENETAFKAAIESLADSVWSPTEHKRRLEAIAEEFPNNSRTAALRGAAQQVSAWVAVQRWSQITEGWNKKFLADAATLEDRLRAVEEYVSKNPGTPIINPAKEYLEYLRLAEVATREKGPWKSDYKAILSRPIYHDLVRVKVNTGKTYYLIPDSGNPRTNSVGTSFSAIVSSDLTKPLNLEFKPGLVGKAEPAPHSVFAKTWVAHINEFRDANWDTFGLEAAFAVTSQPDIDPIIKLILLQKTISILRKCAWGIEDVDSLARKIDAKTSSDDTWLNPDDPNATAQRNAATDVLANLPSLDEMIQIVKRKRMAMLKPLQFEVVANGVILQNGSEWRILLQTKGAKEFKNGQRLLITADKGKTLRDIGGVVDGKPALDLTRMIGVEEGTLVFVCDTKGD